MNTPRRKVIAALASGLLPVLPSLAQQTCVASGLTVEEILQQWKDANNQAELDRLYFNVSLKRLSKATFAGVKDNATVMEEGVIGVLSVNGRMIGDTVENFGMRIAPGVYKGRLRYVSAHNFVQGPLSVMAEKGDFLLEVVDHLNGRTNLLVHSGTKPWHSRGCILAGAAKRKTIDGREQVTVADDSTLRKLRLAFYGKDVPDLCPMKKISVTIVDL